MQILARRDLDVKNIEKQVKERINEIIDLVACSHDHTILLIDEVPTVDQKERHEISFARYSV